MTEDDEDVFLMQELAPGNIVGVHNYCDGWCDRCGFANRPTSRHRDDGLVLTDCYISAVVRCAPPDNKPLPEERDRCLPFLIREIRALRRVVVIVTLGAFAWDGTLRALKALGHVAPRPRPAFGHGVQVRVGPYLLLGSYHPSQRNTSTKLLSEAALDEIFATARVLIESHETSQSNVPANGG